MGELTEDAGRAGIAAAVIQIHNARNDTTYYQPIPSVSDKLAAATLKLLGAALAGAKAHIPLAGTPPQPGGRLDARAGPSVRRQRRHTTGEGARSIQVMPEDRRADRSGVAFPPSRARCEDAGRPLIRDAPGSGHPVHQPLGLELHVQSGALPRLGPGGGRASLHEVEHALRRAALPQDHRLDDPARVGPRKPRLRRKSVRFSSLRATT